MSETIKFNPFDELDEECLMTFEEFKISAKYGIFTDDDGYGYYATSDKVSNVYINFSDVLNNTVPEWVTHVCWYNK